jgi:hypothetical protein
MMVKKKITIIILFMLMIKKVIKIIKKKVKSHQNIENLKFIKSAFKIPNALNAANYIVSLYYMFYLVKIYIKNKNIKIKNLTDKESIKKPRLNIVAQR